MRRLLVAAAVVVAVFLVGNFVLERVAEGQVSSTVQGAFDLPKRPSVNISAFPIVVRLLQGRIPRMTVSARDVPVEGLRLGELSVVLHGIEAGFDVLGTPGAEVRVARVVVVAEAGQRAVNDFLELQGIEAQVSLKAGTRVAVRATPVIGGRRREVLARGRLVFRRGVLSFDPDTVTVDGRPAGGALERQARRAAAFSVRLPELPGDIRVEGVEVERHLVRLVAEAAGYRLRFEGAPRR